MTQSALPETAVAMRAHDHSVVRDLLRERLRFLHCHPDGDVPHGDGPRALDLPGGVLILVTDVEDIGAAPLLDLGVQLGRGDRSRHAGLSSRAPLQGRLLEPLHEPRHDRVNPLTTRDARFQP